MKRTLVSVLTLIVMLSLTSFAASLTAKVVLPDGNGAPFAEVKIGEKTFVADEKGNVELTYNSEKNALVKWLDLEEELPIGDTMKFSNKKLYGAPYDPFDWLVSGSETWDIDDKIMANPGGEHNEAQIFLDDEFDDFIVRSKFVAAAPSQWYYVRFFLRGAEPGFNGYGISFAANPSDQTFFARFEGSWDKYEQITDSLFVYPAVEQNVPHEFVGFLKNDHIVLYLRAQGESKYHKLVDVVDDSDGALFDGSVSILNSFCDVEISEFSIFKY
ncbi:MAG TPA: hypothetical protein GX522_04380 [Firmicutes bacterium]|jgi:hypothetical protein|nr:hypothetical protein [Bacillota bacterium]